MKHLYEFSNYTIDSEMMDKFTDHFVDAIKRNDIDAIDEVLDDALDNYDWSYRNYRVLRNLITLETRSANHYHPPAKQLAPRYHSIIEDILAEADFDLDNIWQDFILDANQHTIDEYTGENLWINSLARYQPFVDYMCDDYSADVFHKYGLPEYEEDTDDDYWEVEIIFHIKSKDIIRKILSERMDFDETELFKRIQALVNKNLKFNLTDFTGINSYIDSLINMQTNYDVF